ncbi:MAG: hypothetical protein ABIW58_02980 [Sphingomicrobium sp.]
MVNGLEQRLPVDNGPAVASATARAGTAPTRHHAWGKLSADRRLAPVERRLRTSTNFIDGYPLAL